VTRLTRSQRAALKYVRAFTDSQGGAFAHDGNHERTFRSLRRLGLTEKADGGRERITGAGREALR
jgi:uncharacterized protein YjhX (UPF0386 family)